jgi:hypothetical protein
VISSDSLQRVIGYRSRPALASRKLGCDGSRLSYVRLGVVAKQPLANLPARKPAELDRLRATHLRNRLEISEQCLNVAFASRPDDDRYGVILNEGAGAGAAAP